jgi:hypothetical protein
MAQAQPPLIFSKCQLSHTGYKIRGCVDLLVPSTSSFLGIPEDEQKGVDDDSLYVPVILTTSDNVSEYRKFQVCFYSLLLKSFPGVVSSTLFLYNMRTRRVQRICPCSERCRRLLSYVKWVRNIRNFGWIYSVSPPSHRNLYPNMKITVGHPAYDAFKEDMARRLHDVTLLWRCSPIHRSRVQYTPFTDIESSQLGLSRHVENIVHHMIRLYRSKDEKLYIGDTRMCRDVFCMKSGTTYLYVDFELLDGRIYLIGVSMERDGKSTYIPFFAAGLHDTQILEMLNGFCEWMQSLPQPYIVFYWFAEKRFWTACAYAPPLDFSHWIDMCQVFQESPLIIRNCFNFKLKNVVKWMNAHGWISTVFPQECSNAQMSMVLAERYFTTFSENDFTSLCAYNAADCRALYDIHTFLHTSLSHPGMSPCVS